MSCHALHSFNKILAKGQSIEDVSSVSHVATDGLLSQRSQRLQEACIFERNLQHPLVELKHVNEESLGTSTRPRKFISSPRPRIPTMMFSLSLPTNHWFY